jgi:hypothetical protein
MSEHKVYEFIAVDRPLTEEEIARLRAISSRAEISANRFWNEYSWGDLKANPAKLLEAHFDAYLYYAHWGERRLMLRIPIERVDLVLVRAFFPGEQATCRTVGKYAIVDVHLEDEADDYDLDARWSLAALLPLRAELMQGDMRGAYLVWLLSVATGEIEDGECEPPVPPGLSDRTHAQEALIDFFGINRDLLAAAADGSAERIDDRNELRRWVAALSVDEKDAWLARAVDEPSVALGGELLRAFRAERPPSPSSVRRTVAELRSGAASHEAARREAARVRRLAAKKSAEASRNKRLDALAAATEEGWTELEARIERSAYDEALVLALDLRDLARREGAEAAFGERFEALRKRRIRRRGFFSQWKAVGSRRT